LHCLCTAFAHSLLLLLCTVRALCILIITLISRIARAVRVSGVCRFRAILGGAQGGVPGPKRSWPVLSERSLNFQLIFLGRIFYSRSLVSWVIHLNTCLTFEIECITTFWASTVDVYLLWYCFHRITPWSIFFQLIFGRCFIVKLGSLLF